MPYQSNKDLPKSVRDNLPASAQTVYRNAYNEAAKKGWSEERRARYAWGAVRQAGFTEGKDGKWVKKQEVPMDLSTITLESWDEMTDNEKLSVYYELEGDSVSPHEVELEQWTRSYINDLPNAAFAAIEPAYTRGETDNKSARHLPHHGKGVKSATENGSVDLTHYRNARARANQVKPVTDSITESALRRRAESHLAKHTSVLKSDEDAKRKERESRDQEAGLGETQELSALMVGEVHLSTDGKMFDVPLIRAGSWDHPWYGEVVYDTEKLQHFVDNFYADVVGHDLTLTRGHRSLFNPNPDTLGWVADMKLDDGYQLHLLVHPTETGLAEVPHNLRYASAEIKESFVDDETGEEYGPTIVGAAATNNPYITRQGVITVFSDEISLSDTSAVPAVLLVQEKLEVKTMADEQLQEEELETPVPEVVEPAPPAPEPPTFLELPTSNGETIRFTGDDVLRLIKDNDRLSRERHENHVNAAILAAKDRGVIADVLNTAKPILMACSEDAEGTIKLSADGPMFNLYGAVVRLLEVIPSVTKQVTYENPGEPMGGEDELTPEEAERKADARLRQLGIRSGAVSTEDVEI